MGNEVEVETSAKTRADAKRRLQLRRAHVPGPRLELTSATSREMVFLSSSEKVHVFRPLPKFEMYLNFTLYDAMDDKG